MWNRVSEKLPEIGSFGCSRYCLVSFGSQYNLVVARLWENGWRGCDESVIEGGVKFWTDLPGPLPVEDSK